MKIDRFQGVLGEEKQSCDILRMTLEEDEEPPQDELNRAIAALGFEAENYNHWGLESNAVILEINEGPGAARPRWMLLTAIWNHDEYPKCSVLLGLTRTKPGTAVYLAIGDEDDRAKSNDETSYVTR